MEFAALTQHRMGHASTPEGHDSAQAGSEELTPLLRAAQGGDERAWGRLVELYGRRVFALAKSRCRDVNVAEEITQSVFATVAAKLADYTEQGKFEPWLFRVAMNRVRDHVRREKRRQVIQDDGAIDRASDARPNGSVDGGASVAAMSALRRAMDELTDADREVIELRHHGGMSFKQISDILDEPLGTLLARHHRALRKLRELLEGKYHVPAGELS